MVVCLRRRQCAKAGSAHLLELDLWRESADDAIRSAHDTDNVYFTTRTYIYHVVEKIVKRREV